MEHFHYQNQQLMAEGASLAEIADRYGTPCFVYSRAALEDRFRAYHKALAGREHLICYAVKANSNLAVLSVLAGLGSGFDIVSGGELERVMAAGGDPGKVVFSGVGKTEAEMTRALEAGIACFNVESRQELERLNQLALGLGKKAPMSLRVNPAVAAGAHPHIATALRESKFGVALEEAQDLYRRAASLAGLEIVGAAYHIGSQLTSLAPFISAMEQVLQLVDSLREEGMSIRHLDVGGGLGVRYRDESPPSPGEWVEAALGLLGDRPLALIVEPGRSISAEAGLMLTRVEYLKSSHGRHFAVIDGAMNDILRPALYQAWMDVAPVIRKPGGTVRSYDLVGPICEAGDCMAQARQLAIASGDLLAVRGAGAYCFSMSSNYNSRNRAAEVMVDGARLHLARRRETCNDQLALEAPLED